MSWPKHPTGSGDECLALCIENLVLNLGLGAAQKVQHKAKAAASPALLQIGKNIVMPQRCIGCMAKIKRAREGTKINR